MKPFRVAAAAAIAALVYSASPAWADLVTLNFDGPSNAGIAPAKGTGVPEQTAGSAILGYYNSDQPGGFSRNGNQPWNIVFDDNAFAIGSLQDPSGQGNFATAHSGWWAVGSTATGFSLSVTNGWLLTSLSFWYNAGGTGSAPAVSLVTDTGELIPLPTLAVCSTPGTDGFCGWQLIEAAVSTKFFDGLQITKIAFSGTPNKVVFDDITLTTKQRDQPPPLPEPSTTALLALGLAAMGWTARRRKR